MICLSNSSLPTLEVIPTSRMTIVIRDVGIKELMICLSICTHLHIHRCLAFLIFHKTTRFLCMCGYMEVWYNWLIFTYIYNTPPYKYRYLAFLFFHKTTRFLCICGYMEVWYNWLICTYIYITHPFINIGIWPFWFSTRRFGSPPYNAGVERDVTAR